MIESTSDWDDLVLVGRISRPHGLRGHVIVTPDTDFVDERFKAGAELRTRSDRGDEVLVVSTMRVQNGRPVILFEGSATVDDAERLAGRELRVPEAALQPLGGQRYYQHQLLGCVVETEGGERIGEVARVQGGIAGSLLAIDGPRGEILIPLAVDICIDVDPPGRRIRVRLPEGLLELNERKTRAN